MEQKSVIVMFVALLALVAFLGLSSSLTGMAVSNVFKIGSQEVKLVVGQSKDVSGRLITLEAVNQGKSRHEDNVKLTVNGRPIFIRRDSSQNVKGLMIILAYMDPFDGKATLLIRSTPKSQTAKESIRQTVPDLDLGNWPYPFVAADGVTLNNLLIIEGKDRDPDDALAANLVANGIEDITGKMPKVISREIGSGSEPVPLYEGNANTILVGQPCTNEFMAELLETTECDAGLKPGYGLIELRPRGNRAIMIITGNSNEDVIKTAYALKNYHLLENTQLVGDYIFVTGTKAEPMFSKI